MIPIKLTIQGIFSYQEKQTIEFDNLINDQIFGIFGSVGSGKSSILEAITFALYGKMEKMNSRDSINYNLMNLKSNSLLIDFEFSTSENENYRFVVSGKRNSKNFEDVGTLNKKQYKKLNNKWVSNEFNAEDILGLSYDNFKRTIIIPQGKFMEFLQLGDKDRTNMLKEIFNLGKYDLALKVGSFEKENNSHIDNLTGQLERFKETNKDELTNNNNLLETAQKDKQKLSELSEKKNNEFKGLESLKALFDDLKINEEIFKKLDSQKEKINEVNNKIKEYELCLANFKPLLDNKKILTQKENVFSKNISLQKLELDKNTKLLEENSAIFKQTEKEYKNIDKYKLQVEEIGKLQSTFELKNKLSEIDKTIKIAIANSKKQEEQQLVLEKNISSTTNEIKLLEKDQTDISELAKIKEWFVKKENSDKEITILNDSLSIKKENLEKLHNRKQTIISAQKQDKLNIDFTKAISVINELLNSKITEFEKKLEQAKNNRDQLIINKKLEEFSVNLKDGKACPVCGSAEHPNPINFKGIDSEITKLKIQTDNGENYISDLRNYINEYKILETELNFENKNIAEIKIQLKNKQTEQAKIVNEFIWKTYNTNDKEKLISDFENIEKLLNTIKEKRNIIEDESDKLSKLSESINKYKEQINKLTLSKKGISTEIKMLLSQINTIDINSFEEKKVQVLTTEQNRISHEIKYIDENYNKLDKKIESLKLKQAAISSTITELDKQFTDIKTDISKIDTQIESKLTEFEYNNTETIETILKLSLDIKKEKQNINEFGLKLNSANTIITKLKEQIKGKVFDENKYKNILTEIKELSEKVEEINNKIGGLETVIKQLLKDIKQKQDLEKKLKVKELRADDLKTLKKLFKSAGFVQYVSTVYLQQLIDYANVRFHKLTKQSLSLVLGKNNNFDVIDYLNDGKRRSVKTLSGGQTFQASLSLALALAGSVQKLNKADKNFFFLDEGFGTQDEESLRLVFEAIKSLRKENRIVGIISHVDDLQDEITTHLRIVNDEKKGSLISTSWQ